MRWKEGCEDEVQVLKREIECNINENGNIKMEVDLLMNFFNNKNIWGGGNFGGVRVRRVMVMWQCEKERHPRNPKEAWDESRERIKWGELGFTYE